MSKLIYFNCSRKNWRRELTAGFTTFLTMAYIIFVTPNVLGAAGMPTAAVFVATCLTTACGCVLIALLANYPIALSSGIALNVFLTYVLVKGMGFSWQTSLGIIFIAGILLLLISTSRLSKLLIAGIPHSLNTAITAGLGIFIAIIALNNIGIAIPGLQANNHTISVINISLAVVGLLVIGLLYYWRIPGAILLGIITTTLLAFFIKKMPFYGFIASPPSLAPTFLQFNFHGLHSLAGITAIFSIFFVTLFDCTGTIFGLLNSANMLTETDTKTRIRRALVANSLTTIFAGLVGNASTSSYLESSTGMRAGGRTGLTALVVAALFIVTLFFAPLAKAIPIFASAPALFFVASLMVIHLREINWRDYGESIPCLITVITIPLTFSIANGIGAGIISYTIINLIRQEYTRINKIVIGLSVCFIIYFCLVLLTV